MARRVLASGTTLQGRNARAFSLAPHPNDPSTPVLTDITANFAFSNTAHYHYEVDYPPATLTASYYVLCSTTPPPDGTWPHGYSKVQAYTDDVSASLKSVGTMKESGGGKTVYRANNLLLLIPDAALTPPVVVVDLPWQVDF